MTLFLGATAQASLRRLRARLERLGAVDARVYRLDGLRRGHAQDLAASGATQGEILSAGPWRSAAFLNHLKKEDLETSAVLEARMSVPSGDEVPGEGVGLGCGNRRAAAGYNGSSSRHCVPLTTCVFRGCQVAPPMRCAVVCGLLGLRVCMSCIAGQVLAL